MYSIVADNILLSNTGIAYIYKLNQFNESNVTHISEILEKVQKSGEIYVVPTFFETSQLDNKYDSENSNDTLIENLKEKLLVETKQEINRFIKYNYSVYLFITEKNVSFKKSKKYNLLKDLEIPKLTKNERKIIINEEEKLNKVIKTINATEKSKVLRTSVEDTTRLLEYLLVPTNKEVEDYSINVDKDNLKYTYEDSEGEKETKYVSYSQVTTLPDTVIRDFEFVRELTKLNFVVDINIKFEVEDSDKLERKLRNKNLTILKASEKYKNKYNLSLYDTEEKLELNQDFLNSTNKIKYLVTQQINLRINSNEYYIDHDGVEELNNRYHELKKLFKSENIVLTSALGNQEKLANNFLPLKIEDTNNTFITDNNYFQSYNLLSNLEIGVDTKDSIVEYYTYPNVYPVLNDMFAPIKHDVEVKATSPVSIYIGEMGCGKSQLCNNNIMLNIISQNSKELIIDPKGDRKGFISKLKLGGIDPNLIGKEYVIDTSNKYKGALDPFKTIENRSEILIEVASFINMLVSISKINLDNVFINKSIDEYLNENTHHCMMGYLESISLKNKELFDILKSYENYSYINLFYGSTDSEGFELNKPLNIIIFDEISNTHLDTDLKKIFFSYTLSKIDNIVKKFMREQKENLFGVTLEEIGYYKNITNTSIEDELSRLIRSFGGVLRLVTHNITDIEEETLVNIGQMYIGTGLTKKNEEELKKLVSIPEEMLEPLRKSSKNSSTKNEDKYIFLCQDYNKNIALIRQRILPMFSESFVTNRRMNEN